MTAKKTRPEDVPEGAVTEENLVKEKPEPKKSGDSAVKKMDLSEVAFEVRSGKWGVGQERRKKLSEAGYNVKEVEAEVTKQLNS